ncbi:class I SAM-dependent methyltransferase [Gordonia sp. PKS22-38]|uniref:Class I SAM-dependent methyltransferase n=1 Tax=Gordonia prachuapensis TaxID=3115651 RepID=A0ABU7N090_9ACTN|nr:class I SAM-dependent methyltransferase [Gordonia sp. PKS22-38]
MNVPLRDISGHPADDHDDTTPVLTPAEAERWPDVAQPPRGRSAAIRSAAAARLFRHALRGVDVRVEFPDGKVVGHHGDRVLPRMIVRHPEDFARRIGAGGLIGFGESYMAGDWTTDDLVGVLTPFATRVARLVPRPLQALRHVALPKHPSSEDNSTSNTRRNIARHYDLSNDLFAVFLDETMTYSSALFADLQPGTRAPWSDLADAQRRKVDRLLDAAGVGPGTRLLEIGTGWGELCLRAAARGATVRSVTLSSEQQTLARERVAQAGFADRVQIDLCDYRQVEGTYDAVVSVEMIEAVGEKYWPVYFQTIDRVLAPGGRVAIQAITMPHDRMVASRSTYTWVHKYIFPGGQLTSLKALDAVTRRRTSLRMTERRAMGAHYAETLRLWRERFTARRDDVAALGFDNTFRRMWEFYLAYSEAGFRAGYLDVHQLVFTRDDLEDGDRR